MGDWVSEGQTVPDIMGDFPIEKLWHCVEIYPDRAVALAWIIEEWDAYANNKFYADGTQDLTYENDMKQFGWSRDEGFWANQVFQYLARAQIFGVGQEVSESPERGRQAAMKMATILIDGLATMIKVFGLPPEPGHTSGDIVEWKGLR